MGSGGSGGGGGSGGDGAASGGGGNSGVTWEVVEAVALEAQAAREAVVVGGSDSR